MKAYSRVSYDVRCQIYAYLQVNLPISQIAELTGFHKTTIYREINRNSGKREYSSKFAQKKCKKRNQGKGRKASFVGFKRSFALKKLTEGWSPEFISQRYFKERKETFSHQVIYNHVRLNPELKKLFRFVGKTGAGRRRQFNTRKEKLLSIHSRPESAKKRSRFGHWERDGMYGANRKQLLVCLERKSRLIRLTKMPTVNAKAVSKLTEKLLRKEKVLTITNDNGTEFRRPETCKHTIYYCDALKPQQRGSVENVIGALRRHIKKDTDLDKLSNYKIKKIENYLNSTPRRMFDYKTPYEVYYGKKVALVNGT